MRYLSVCSGIEAATVAWHHMGWKPTAFSEIEKFPCQVLKHHYSDVKNLGDMTKYEEWNLDSIDLLVGGTPCQSFSVAGLRKGLDDPRGNLMLTYGAIAKRFKPNWLVWENVPGVLSSNGGRDFATFLGMLAELRYGFAYRVLDAQYFGVAQRRRRVFVVGCLGDWRSAAAVLFERDSLCGNSAPSREKRKGVAAYVESSLAQYRQDKIAGTLKASGGVGGGGSETFVNWPATVCSTLNANFGSKLGLENQHINEGAPMFVPSTVTYEWHNQDSRITESEVAATLSCNAGGREGNLVQPIPYDLKQVTSWANHQYSRKEGDPCHTLMKENTRETAIVQSIGTDCYNGSITGDIAATIGTPGSSVNASGPTVMQPIAYSFDSLSSNSMKSSNPVSGCRKVELSKTLDTTTPEPSKNQGGIAVMQSMAVCRLTPVECERLQGFPDNYTNIKENCPDGPRYKALGNSMAVPVMRWIGERIEQVRNVQKQKTA